MKTSLILIIFSCSLISLKSSASNYRIDKNNTCEDKRFNEANKNIFFRNSLEAKFCERLFPDLNDKKALASRDYGVPSRAQNYRAPKIKEIDHFKVLRASMEFTTTPILVNVSSDGEYPKYPKFFEEEYGFDTDWPNEIALSYDYLIESQDWQGLLDLNIQASKIWDLILEKSDIHQDYDSLKNAYVFGKKLHSKRKGRKEIDHMIKAYQKNVFDFLSSSGGRYTYGVSLIDHFHPFFLQIVIEFASELFAIDFVDRDRFSEFNFRLDYQLLNATLIANPNMMIAYSHWIENFEELLSKYEHRGAIISILSMAATETECLQLGLKPEISRSVLLGIHTDKYRQVSKQIMMYLKSDIRQSCGNVDSLFFPDIQLQSRIYNIYYPQFGKSIVKPFRENGKRFLDSVDWEMNYKWVR
ncbi:hypothetical protein HBN50_12545 [Halobacteriovorax sp. GB3]|uniref:hypothetical protein n=1 Tax=Halobacteriovorax sp. GB3 TaxID=2719615 RepID=UPI002360E420|nr:hypothetical protein [Halobacteriovorax sp. GB3]MDD0853933.1 hypothetical protein [Halobacteriovorax sp. GB3]